MTINQLIEYLQTFPPELEVLERRYSDYDLMEKDNWHIVQAVNKGYYRMRTHYSLTEEDKAKAKNYLLFEGN